jgi:hypothetical protein
VTLDTPPDRAVAAVAGQVRLLEGLREQFLDNGRLVVAGLVRYGAWVTS